jgi:hypothetical protein
MKILNELREHWFLSLFLLWTIILIYKCIKDRNNNNQNDTKKHHCECDKCQCD